MLRVQRRGRLLAVVVAGTIAATGGGLAAAFPVSPDHYKYRDPEGTRHEAFTMNQLGLTANLGIGLILD